jgi:hypothetical protein
MAISDTHPDYQKRAPDWQLCRDSYEGERTVKQRGKTYLPPTSGQIADGMANLTDKGYVAYQNYKQRAIFHDFFRDAIEIYMGIMWSKDPVIELPPQLEPLLKKATNKKENLFQLLRRMNEQQLTTGRLGLLLDLPTTPQPVGTLPYIAMYTAESVLNWDDGGREETPVDELRLVVLNESEFVRSQFTWEFQNLYRVLFFGAVEEDGAKAYRVGVFKDNDEFSLNSLKTPIITGQVFNEIPFVFVNTKDIVAEPDSPPLIGVANLGMAIYRGEADYRQNLHMQGQDTLVVTGIQQEDTLRIGTGTALILPAGDAKFIGVNSAGLPEQAKALESDKTRIISRAGQLLDMRSKQTESGDALEKRISAQTATLRHIALSSAGGLEKILKIMATMVGADPEKVKITPNLDFADNKMTAEELVSLMSAKTLGAPLSQKTIHENMSNRGMTTKTYEEELTEISEEEPLVTGTGTGVGGDGQGTQNAQ